MTTQEITNQFWLGVAKVFDRNSFPGSIIFALLFVAGALLAGWALRAAVHRYLDRAERAGADPTAIRFLGQLANLVVYIGAFILYSQYNQHLEKLGTAWLASVGVVSVVVGLAAQSTLGNLIAGISLVLYRPFKLGDRLQITAPTGLETGVVESINLGYTVLRAPDDRRFVIPNSNMASQTSINLSQARARVAAAVTVTLAASADIDRARKILIDAVAATIRKATVENCRVTALSGAGATLTLSVWCADADSAAEWKSELLQSAQKQFEAAGIKVV